MCRINCSGGCPSCSPEDHSVLRRVSWWIKGYVSWFQFIKN